MGSKRVGLARTEALIENLKRELTMGGTTKFAGVALSNKAAAASSTTTLTNADSGKIILMAPNAAAIVLPTPVKGMNFKIIQVAPYSTAVCTIKTVTTDGSVFFVGGYASGDSSDGNISDNNSNDVITFGSATVAGDYVELIALSTSLWHVTGFAQSGHSSNGIAFSDS